MSQQGDLFGEREYPERPGYVRGSDTSKEAAVSVDSIVSGLRLKVLEFITTRRWATCDMVEEALGLRHQTASARIRELVLMGKLRDSGTRMKTRSGHSARVYVRKETSA